MNVLLTSCGRRVALVRAFRRELRAHHAGSKVLGADASPWSAAVRQCDAAVTLPAVDDPEYVPTLRDVVRRHQVRVVVPLIDPELPVLAPHRATFLDDGCHVVISDPEVVAISRDKRASALRFRELGFGAPRVIEGAELEVPERLRYPVFVKPAAGSSSIDARRIDGADELRFWLARTQEPVVQSFETGREFTIDVLADLDGRACCAVPRQRWETRGGEISKGRTDKSRKLMGAASRLVEALGGCRGCITLQCFDPGDDAEPVFFEANLRFGGGFPLSYRAGANYPRWILEMCAGKRVRAFDGWRDGLVMLRYDAAVFIEPGGAA